MIIQAQLPTHSLINDITENQSTSRRPLIADSGLNSSMGESYPWIDESVLNCKVQFYSL